MRVRRLGAERQRRVIAAVLAATTLAGALAGSGASGAGPAQTAQAPARETTRPASDVERVLQLAIDYAPLQRYLKPVAASANPQLFVLAGGAVDPKLALSKFGRPVEVADCASIRKQGRYYIEVRTLDIADGKARVVYRVRAEEVEVRLALLKAAAGWLVESGELVKAKFIDKGC